MSDLITQLTILIHLIILVVSSFFIGWAGYRLTRFLVIDTLISGIRNKFHSFVVNQAQKNGKLKKVWEKLYDLTSCTWCTGFWVSFALYWAWFWKSPADWNQYDIIAVFAIAGVQGILHAIEPDNE